jgi:hypothetical protein
VGVTLALTLVVDWVAAAVSLWHRHSQTRGSSQAWRWTGWREESESIRMRKSDSLNA